jgi:hypothetical protein
LQNALALATHRALISQLAMATAPLLHRSARSVSRRRQGRSHLITLFLDLWAPLVKAAANTSLSLSSMKSP